MRFLNIVFCQNGLALEHVRSRLIGRQYPTFFDGASGKLATSMAYLPTDLIFGDIRGRSRTIGWLARCVSFLLIFGVISPTQAGHLFRLY